MSNLSTQVFGDMNYLYEQIANRDAQQLNENSEHYDEEFAELVEDIISTISLSMVHEGYSANGIISFLANSPNEDIIEKYLNFDENVITESTVSEDYIQEQLDQLNEFVGAALRVLGAGLKAAKYAKNVKGAAPVARLAAGFKGAGTAAERVAKQGFKQSSVIRSGLSKGADKVKDIAKGAKAALTSPTAKKIGLGAAGLGAATGAGYIGAKLAGAGSGQGPSPTAAKPAPSSTQQKPPAAPILPPPSGSGTGSDGGSRKGGGKSAPAKAKAPDKGPEGETPMQKWARLHPGLASKVKPGQSGYDEISKTREKPGPYEKKDQTPTTGPEPTEAQKSQAGADIAAIQAKQKADFEKKQKEVSASTQKESYDAYDLVLEYLINFGHADTLAEAEYVMSELDSEMIDSIVESYQ